MSKKSVLSKAEKTGFSSVKIDNNANSEAGKKYRVRGLDGIRALACIAVLVYHFIPGKVVGGFLGVDVFFVLSGFLITVILVKELNRSGKLDFKKFWLRRTRRLLPAVLAAVLFIMPLAGLVGSDALVGIKRQVLGAVTFSYNWVQILFGTSYFTQHTPEIFTNVWSLAVEQQFYILWPVVLLIIWKAPKKTRPIITLLLAVLSALGMYYLFNPDVDASRVYMGTDTHSFGIMLGATLALISPNALQFAKSSSRFAFIRAVFGWAGIAVILVCFFIIDDKNPFTYPFGMLIACVATLLLIQALQDDVVSYSAVGGVLADVLDWKPLVWFGERSYGIYLWHWPIWVLAILYFPTVNIYVIGVIATVITVIVSELSYKYIETPMRFNGIYATIMKWTFTDKNTGIVGTSQGSIFKKLIPLMVAGIMVSSISYDFYKEPSQSSAEKYLSNSKNQNVKNNTGKENNKTDKQEKNSDSKLPDMNIASIDGSKVLVIGDSVTLASKPAFETVIPNSVVDGEVSRSIWSGIELINNYGNSGILPKVVVISLATNSAVTEENLNDILNGIGTDRLLVLVTAFGPARTTWVPPSNEVIRNFAAKHKDRVRVAAWDEAIANRTEHLAGDLVHPDGIGGEIYANTVLEAIKSFGSRKLADVAIVEKPKAKK